MNQLNEMKNALSSISFHSFSFGGLSPTEFWFNQTILEKQFLISFS